MFQLFRIKFQQLFKPGILVIVFYTVSVHAQFREFRSDLYSHLKSMHSKFSVTQRGYADDFLPQLEEIVKEVVDSVVSDNVVVNSYSYSSRYNSARIKVTFNVEYVTTAGPVFDTEEKLAGYVYNCLAEKKDNFDAGFRLNSDADPRIIGERVFNEANSKLQSVFRQVQVSTYECTFTTYENYILFRFGVIYVLPELLSGNYAYSNEELMPLIYENLKERKISFAVHLLSKDEKYNAFAAYEQCTKSDEYLSNNIEAITYRVINFGVSKIVVFDVDYFTTLEEEKFVEEETSEILREIVTESMTDYDKIKAVHDYIIENVAYDNSDNYKSAYAALTEGKSVCNGYTLLADKFLTQLGFETRIIHSPEMKHTWNMVKLEENWYHIDLTWDDPIPDVKGRVMYDYFLLSDRDIMNKKKRHTWNRKEYPAALKSYW